MPQALPQFVSPVSDGYPYLQLRRYISAHDGLARDLSNRRHRMTRCNLDKYIKMLNKQVKEDLSEQELDSLIGDMDLLWYSLSETEQKQASTIAKVLSNYYKGR